LRGALPATADLTRVAQWHLTLVFLGEVDDAREEAVAEILSGVPAPAPFPLRLAGGGRYGEVAWAAVDGEVDRLRELQGAVRTALAAGGFPSDERPFRPHLTVSYHSDGGTRQALAGFSGDPWDVTEFTLVRSLRGVYERLRAWPLIRP
jgi:RNA 2',3'-cyclic 3'-phosphodiesterase